jgi:hypothetical protein
MFQTALRLLVLGFAGFLTWGLVLLRNHAQDCRRAALLASLICCDELIGITLGVYLARKGGASDIVVVALGGALAAFLMMKICGKGK